MLDWGAPEHVQQLHLPGDSLSEAAYHTRAVFIKAEPGRVWPWIVQLGQERGGFYSYTFLENLFLAEMKNTYVLKQEYQGPRMVGDTVWLATRQHYNGMGHQVLAMVETERAFVMTNGSDYQQLLHGKKAEELWAIYLHREKEGTWLIARSVYNDGFLRYVLYEIPHFIMEQKMLRSICDLAQHDDVDHDQGSR